MNLFTAVDMHRIIYDRFLYFMYNLVVHIFAL